MANRAIDQDAIAFGERLVSLLADREIARRGAGAYLAGKYKVSTVTANDWLNGRFKPNTASARQIAEDHGSTFDWLYFGAPDTARLSTASSTAAAQPVRLDVDRLALALAIVDGAIKDSGKRVPDAFRARMIKYVYEDQRNLTADNADTVSSAMAGLLQIDETP